MKKPPPYIISIIKNLPIKRIVEVYLTGLDSSFYRVILKGSSMYAVSIDLKKGIKNNFRTIDKSNYNIEDKITRKIKPEQAKKLLEDCKYDNSACSPNNEILKVVLELLEINDFRNLKKNKENHTFSSWIRLQNGRDDLIGDLAYDMFCDSSLSGYESYEEFNDRVLVASKINSWEINSFRSHKKMGMVNPSLILRLAKMEYEIYKRQTMLKRFGIRNTSGNVYFLNYEGQFSPVKIGRAKNIENRVSQLQTSSHIDLEIIGYIETNDYFILENEIHSKFDSKKLRREWFSLGIDKAKEIIRNYNGIITK